MSSPTSPSLVAAVSTSAVFIDRGRTLARHFGSEFFAFSSADGLSESGKTFELVFLDVTSTPSESEAAGLVQVARYTSQDAGILVVAEKKLPTKTAEFLKKSGATGVLLEDEWIQTSKAEFLAARRLRGQWIPIKASELLPDRAVNFTVFHMLPLNRKFLPALHKGDIPSPDKIKKLLAVGEFYLQRPDVYLFREYTEHNKDLSAGGLKARCRAQFLSLTLAYKDLVVLLTDQSEGSSFPEGKRLFDVLVQMTQGLIGGLGATGESWDVINNSAVDDLTPVDRAPAVAAFAGLLSLLSGIGKAEEIMLAALLADIGLLDLPPLASTALKAPSPREVLQGEARTIYENHPQRSIAHALSRKLPLPEAVKDIINNTHERTDRKGFPKQPVPEKIPQESLLIQFAEKIDQSCLVEMGKPRPDIGQKRLQVWQHEHQKLGETFPLDFLNQLKPHLL